MIVLRIADCKCIARRCTQHCECGIEARRLADPLCQGHHAAAVEEKNYGHLQVVDDIQHLVRGAGICVDQALACLERRADVRESGQQQGLDRLCKDRRVTAVWKVDYRAVLGNDSVYKAELTGDPTKFGKNPAGDKHHLDAPAAGTSL